MKKETLVWILFYKCFYYVYVILNPLLELLKLETEVNYAPLPESEDLRKGLADFIGLEKNTGYCDIADKFVDITSDFLVEVQSRSKLSHVKWGPVSLHPNDFAH